MRRGLEWAGGTGGTGAELGGLTGARGLSVPASGSAWSNASNEPALDEVRDGLGLAGSEE